MLHLASETPDGWAERRIAEMDTVLIDHAHCEKKAASTALSMLWRYPQHHVLLQPLSALAREELEHFEQVVALLHDRGVPLRNLPPAPYAKRLHAAIRSEEPGRLVDSLLTCAVIEARSCERMKRLAEALPPGTLRDFYRSLLACEARHHVTYVDLAAHFAPRAAIDARLAELMAHEAEVIAAAPEEPRLHS